MCLNEATYFDCDELYIHIAMLLSALVVHGYITAWGPIIPYNIAYP